MKRMIDTLHNTSAHIIQLWMDISRTLRRDLMTKGKAASICMNPMQVHGMAIIAEHPSITMKEFATQLHISSPSATSFVDRLVKGQWVERVPNPDNRKLVHVRLTASGRATLASAMKEHSAVMHDLFSLLSPEDQSQLERVLVHLKEALAQNIASQ